MYNSGNFIRLHTRRVFAKEGLKSDNGQQYNEWRQEDIIENSKIIRSRMKEFFSNTEMSPEESQYQNYKGALQ